MKSAHVLHGLLGATNNSRSHSYSQAGLFSAAVTAFAVEAFQWLEADPIGVNNKVLMHVSVQLSNMSQPSTPYEPIPFSPSWGVIRVNIFWFWSLVTSLGTVLLGILCSQWIREFERDVTQYSVKDAISIRHVRFLGFHQWKVPQVITALPFLLQISVVLFFIGVADLLFQRNLTVGLVVSVPIVGAIGFLVFTTCAPTVQWLFAIIRPPSTPQLPVLGQNHIATPSLASACPYKSPQSWLMRQVVVRLLDFSKTLFKASRYRRMHTAVLYKLRSAKSWLDMDMQYRATYSEATSISDGTPHIALAWIWSLAHLCQVDSAFYDLIHCFGDDHADGIRSVIVSNLPDRMSTTGLESLDAHSVVRCSDPKLGEKELLSLLLAANESPVSTILLQGEPSHLMHLRREIGLLWLLCRICPRPNVELTKFVSELNKRVFNSRTLDLTPISISFTLPQLWLVDLPSNGGCTTCRFLLKSKEFTQLDSSKRNNYTRCSETGLSPRGRKWKFESSLGAYP